MGWVGEKALWFVLPAFDDVFIRRESLQGFESFCEVVQVFFELPVMFIIVASDGCLF